MSTSVSSSNASTPGVDFFSSLSFHHSVIDEWHRNSCYWQVRFCVTLCVLCPLIAAISMRGSSFFISKPESGDDSNGLRNRRKRKARNHYRMVTVADYVCVSTFFLTLGTAIAIALRRLAEGLRSTREGTWTWPNPLGLSLGILSVFIFQVFLVGFHYARHRWGVFGASGNVIQTEKPHLDFSQELVAHATRWEGIALLLPYLCLTWMLRMMPDSYYDLTNESACVSFFGLFDPTHVFLQLISVDFFMYLAHITEHRLGWLYRKGHKKHHKWTNPRLFDAYSGHIYDTTLMILVPLYATANVVPSNCGGYICFGTTYSAYLMLIHSEYALPWDAWSRALGIGTAHDHNVHHTKIVYNFGHFFMLWDQLFGTYMDPTTVKKFRVYEKTSTSVE